ncbi:MAG: tRNA lysidine(34) synthetase TilS [Anaerolineales bacterium]|nr:tRNA lysidine(34) synthetase TilS [Anaerolineales bacterium]
MILEKIHSALKEKCLIKTGDKILLAVSGGPDSLFLLNVLGQLGYPLVIAHLDHQLRPESAQEAAFVSEIATRSGLPIRLGRFDVKAMARDQGLSLEEAARLARYRFLFEQARLEQIQTVATGHTADDQVETVLMHLLRGAGLAGLGGMDYRSLPNSWSQDIALIRPLLGIWRGEIMAYLEEQNIHATTDASNLDTRFYRNRLRHELIPYLERYNPNLRRNLIHTAETLRQDMKFIEEKLDEAWSACVRGSDPAYIWLDPLAIKNLPLSIQRHLLRRAIQVLRPNLRDMDFEVIERAVNFLAAPTRSHSIELVAGLCLLSEPDSLWLAGWEAELPVLGWPQLESQGVLLLDAPGKVELAGGWLIQAEKINSTPALLELAQSNCQADLAWLDLANLSLPLQVRPRLAGDRFQPLGMGGHSIKLSDLMINSGIPRRARGKWPLVCSGGKIAWIPGLRMSHLFRVDNQTSTLVQLKLSKEG